MPDAAAPPPAAEASGAPRRSAWERLAPLALGLAAAALLISGFVLLRTHDSLRDMELQLARRIGEFDASSREARAAAKEARATSEDLQARLAALEAKALETQNQQLALSSMYQELARGQDERLLADIEQGLLLARQQLHLAGNARAAIAGLEALDARLAKLSKARFEGLRQAVARDIAQLRLLPTADVVGLNARLDALIAGVDKLKLPSDPVMASAAQPGAKAPVAPWWQRWRDDAWEELKQILRIRRMDQAEVPLLAPNQAYYLRQNLKLRLLAARLSLVQRDEVSFRGDIGAAEGWLLAYFNPDDPLSQTMLADLRALATLPVANRDSDILDSLKALRALRPEAP